MAKRVSRDTVALDFEATIPLLGRDFRTSLSKAGKPPYYELAMEGEGQSTKCQIVFVPEPSAGPVAESSEDLTSQMSLRETGRLLEGIRLADRLASKDD